MAISSFLWADACEGSRKFGFLPSFQLIFFFCSETDHPRVFLVFLNGEVEVSSRFWIGRYSQIPPCGHLAITDTSLLRTPRYYGKQQNPRRKLQTFDKNKLPLLRTLATTDLQTLYSVPTSQFYCFLSRYSGHRAASWNICTHIKSIFSAF